jgi:hypothetical protein
VKPRVSVVLVVLLLTAGNLPAEVVFGGTGEIHSSLFAGPQNPGHLRIDWSTQLNPSFRVDSQCYRFFFRSALGYQDNAARIETRIDELYLVLDPLPFLRLRLGRFSYLAGSGLFFSNTRYFARVDFTELLTGRTETMILAGDMVQMSFFVSDFYLTLTAAPFAAAPIVPDPDSPWFPDKDLPRSITVHFPSTQVLLLDEILLQEAQLPPFEVQNASASAELGGTMYPVDFALLYYHGSDNSPLMKAAVDFPEGLFESYDIILTPVFRSIDALGLNLALQAGPFTFWTDDSFTFSKTLLSNRLSSSAMETALQKHPYLEICLGASYRPSFVDGLLAAEYHDAFALAEDTSLIEPLLSSVLVAALQCDFLQERLSPALTWIQSLHDRSGAVHLRFSFKPSMELEARLSAPLFFGEADSELGQFRGKHLFAGGVVWRF